MRDWSTRLISIAILWVIYGIVWLVLRNRRPAGDEFLDYHVYPCKNLRLVDSSREKKPSNSVLKKPDDLIDITVHLGWVAFIIMIVFTEHHLKYIDSRIKRLIQFCMAGFFYFLCKAVNDEWRRRYRSKKNEERKRGKSRKPWLRQLGTAVIFDPLTTCAWELSSHL